MSSGSSVRSSQPRTPDRTTTGLKSPHFRGSGKSKLDVFRPEIEALLANGTTQKFIAQRYHTTEANWHNWMKKRGLTRPTIGKLVTMDERTT